MIRHATLADVPVIVAMSAKFYATTPYDKFARFDAGSVGALAQYIVQTGVMLIAEDDAGNAIGMVGLIVAPWPMNNAVRMASEVVWWVDPDARNGGAGVGLLREVTKVCRERECAIVQMMHLNTSPAQAAMLYERLGYYHSESTYTKVL